jgi:hypothetical protein
VNVKNVMFVSPKSLAYIRSFDVEGF